MSKLWPDLLLAKANELGSWREDGFDEFRADYSNNNFVCSTQSADDAQGEQSRAHRALAAESLRIVDLVVGVVEQLGQDFELSRACSDGWGVRRSVVQKPLSKLMLLSGCRSCQDSQSMRA